MFTNLFKTTDFRVPTYSTISPTFPLEEKNVKDDVDFFKEVCIRFSLLKTLNCSSTVKIAELADELGILKTDFLQYILKNNGYFVVKVPQNGLGLEISDIFDSLEKNPETTDWLNKKIADNSKNVWMTPIREFNSISGWQLLPSSDDPSDPTMNRFRSKWKNTQEKVDQITALNFLHKQQFYFGPYSERVPRIFDNACLDAEKADMIEKFKKAGWNLIFEG